MAFPSLATVAAAARSWWRRPGRPRLDELRAQLASLCTDPLTSVRVAVVNVPPLTLVVRYETRDGSGAVVNSVQRSATKDDLDAAINRDFADVLDDGQASPRERGEIP